MAKNNYSDWTREQLIEELRKLKKLKKYGVVWEDKSEDVAELCKKLLPVLDEDESKAINTSDKEPVNIIIEGDNYHSLSVLNYTHKSSIDLIYIDPPYNTGNKSWKYNNNYIESEDAYRHSKWLSFMNKRLHLARNLLKPDGAIVITIDDYEVGGLRLLMDEIFGEENRLGLVTIMHNPRGRSDDKFFATSHEYALFYGKNAAKTKTYKLKLTEEQEEDFPFEDEVSRYRLLPLKRTGSNSTPKERPNLYFPIYFDPKSNSVSLDEKIGYIKILPIDSNGENRVWRWGKESLAKRLETEVIIKQQGNGNFSVLAKDRIKDGRKPKTVWVDPKYDASSHGTILLEKILGKNKAFDYPKSLFAVMDALQVIIREKKDAIILDFFAGSGTTGQAVLEINNGDGGNRRFILCTNNEDNNNNGSKIAEDVCYPRIKKVLEGYGNQAGLGGNLKYFRTDFVDSSPTDMNKKKLVDKSTEMLCLKEDSFNIIKLTQHYKIFSNGKGKYVGIIYEDEGIEGFKHEVIAINKVMITYVFSLDDSAREEEFEDVTNLVDLKPIPEVILNVYRRIFK